MNKCNWCGKETLSYHKPNCPKLKELLNIEGYNEALDDCRLSLIKGLEKMKKKPGAVPDVIENKTIDTIIKSLETK